MCPLCGYRGSFSGLRRSGREFDHSRPTSSDVKFEWIYTSAHGNSALRRRLVIFI